jgi:hypothetical protein
MITYKEFIEKMIEKGYTHKNGAPINIAKNNGMIKTFCVNKGQTGKIIEFFCPENQIMALCGTEHEGGCYNDYICDIKCYDNHNNEPFQETHYSTELTKDKHVLAEIIATKILRNDPPIQYTKVREWSETISPILRLIGSNNNREHIMWVGAYQKFNSEFNKSSFTLYGNQKMTFYVHHPSTDIARVDFRFDIDIFERNDNITFSGQY